MDMEEAYKMGFLLVPPQSFLRKTWIKRYCALYNASNHGIQRIELFESEDAYVKLNPSKIIPLTDCVKVTPAPQKQQPNVFEVRTKDNTYQFSADTFQEMSEWLVSLQTVAFGKIPTKVPIAVVQPVKDEKQEENMLYSSMDEPEVYAVKAVATEPTLRNNLKGDYKLVITSMNISVAEECSQGRIGRIILTWPYRHIRRYGCSTENFSFEAGRKCVSGEGLFTFSTNDGMLIFQSVDAHVTALKSSQNEADIPNSPSLNEDASRYVNFFTSKDSLCSRKESVQKVISRITSGNENDANAPSKTSMMKPLPPLTKPPRKSKSNNKATYPCFLDNSAIVSNVTNDEMKFSPNLYEELYRASSPDESSVNSAVSYAPNSSSYAQLETSVSSTATVGNDHLCSSVENFQISDKAWKESCALACSSDYENCDPISESKHSRPGFPQDHVYGKLRNTKQCLTKNSGNTYGSLITTACSTSTNATSPVYSNVPQLEQALNDMSVQDEFKRDPEHFMQNDAEYAQVFKKSGNTSF